jgi:hypothetical protein
MRSRLLTVLTFIICHLSFSSAGAQVRFSQPHGFYDAPFQLTITSEEDAEADIRYTLDGSEPTATSTAYTAPLNVSGTTIVRAAAVVDGQLASPIATATYIFVDDVLRQSNTPEGYPAEWGSYTQEWGTAIADYEMDPEMTQNPALAPKIREGLLSLPALSIVTDRDNLFSHENDSVHGGIYIFTGPPVGDNTGHGWTRPASVELIPANSVVDGLPSDFYATCGLRLHGGHGRLAEKNPKHSFRLVFKKDYGQKSLEYPLFGESEPQLFKQLVLRCHFGNSWQHWSEGNRTKAQYARDVWARRMQRRLGHTSVNARYVNLFLNGMYWGMYNMAERVDDQYGKDHLGGEKSDIDVVKIEEDGGNHIEASEGDLNAWQLMVELCRIVAGKSPSGSVSLPRDITPDKAYTQLQDSLLDLDDFIDYMIINQYGGNTDWDHHNWYAIRRRGTDSQGFRFLCWDTEIIFENERENVLSKNNGSSFPTGMFQNLLRNDDFARRYLRRAKQLLSDDGQLGQTSVVELWDSLYNTVHSALYAEAARWGDYRRDVHPWQSRGKLYTVDNTYMAERQRLLTQYFPVRTDNVRQQIIDYLGIDDFEVPDGWEQLTAQMFHRWNGSGADAEPFAQTLNIDWNIGVSVSNGGVVAGQTSVSHDVFADLSDYDFMVLRGSGSGLRILANRLVAHGPWKQIVVDFNEWSSYWDSGMQAVVVPLEELRTMNTTNNEMRIDDFLHLNALKVDWSSTCTVSGIYLIPSAERLAIKHASPYGLTAKQQDGPFVYDLQGRQITNGQLQQGIYIQNGRKIIQNKRNR